MKRNEVKHGYCEHGTYVGGCGFDHMCGYCEMGISAKEVVQIHNEQLRLRENSHVEMIKGLHETTPISVECQKALIEFTESNFNKETAQRVKNLFE